MVKLIQGDVVKCLITGASSGIGRSLAKKLSDQGYDLILVARSEDKLLELKKELKTNTSIIIKDLKDQEEVMSLYEELKNENIDLLINNAGFGLFGLTHETDLNKELEMIDLNIKAVHILTKLFLKDFIKKDSGKILNVSSSAGFLPGPKLNTYYATKNYVTQYTLAISEELKQIKSNVKISCLCPGPVNTQFNQVANGNIKIKGIDSDYVANYTLKKLAKNKLIIIPTFKMKVILLLSKMLPLKLLLKINYNIQERKSNNVR